MAGHGRALIDAHDRSHVQSGVGQVNMSNFQGVATGAFGMVRAFCKSHCSHVCDFEAKDSPYPEDLTV